MVFALQQILIDCLIAPDYIRFRIEVIGIPVFVIRSDLLGIIESYTDWVILCVICMYYMYFYYLCDLLDYYLLLTSNILTDIYTRDIYVFMFEIILIHCDKWNYYQCKFDHKTKLI